MQKLIPFFLFSIFLFTATDASSQNNNKSEIENLIQDYQKALNASDVNSVVSLYTQDAVLIPNAAPTADGLEQIKQTYEYVFDNFSFNLDFDMLEIEVIGKKAYARSTSKGNLTIKANGETVPDENRELFIFEKQNGNWKIARYMYNKSK